MEHDENEEDPDDDLSDGEPRDRLDVVPLRHRVDVLVNDLFGPLLLFEVLVVGLSVCLLFNLVLRAQLLQ